MKTADIKWTKRIEERDINRKWLEDNIFDLEFAGLYLGDEMNTFHFDWDSAVREGRIDKTWRVVIANLVSSYFSLSAPAVALFYQQLHEYFPEWAIERSFCPPTGFDKELMEKDGIRPFAAESGMPLEAFDVMCLSIDLSGSYAAVPWIIMKSGIPLFSRVHDLDEVFVITKPYLNFSVYHIYNDHYEISRGCEGKCAFCMGGFTSLPYRSRSAELVKQTMDTIIHETGNTAVTPVSFNSVSHPEINRIVRDLTDAVGDKVSLISMRMDGFLDNPELCCFLSMQRKGRIAFGVEGASHP